MQTIFAILYRLTGPIFQSWTWR